MVACIAGFGSCRRDREVKDEFQWVVDRFDDIRVLKYQVPEFDSLSLNDKLLVYYLGQAALCGRDILFDQNGKYNLRIRRTLEAIYQGYTGDREDERFKQFEKYLKPISFARSFRKPISTCWCVRHRKSFSQPISGMSIR